MIAYVIKNVGKNRAKRFLENSSFLVRVAIYFLVPREEFKTEKILLPIRKKCDLPNLQIFMEFYHFLQIKTQILFFFFQFQEIIFCYYFNYYLFYCFTLLLTLCVIGFICDIYFGSILYVYILSAVCLQFAETWQDPSRKNNNNVRRPHHPNNSLRSLKKSSKTRTLMTSYLLSV